jgi:hypothetical protein
MSLYYDRLIKTSSLCKDGNNISPEDLTTDTGIHTKFYHDLKR